MRNYKNKMARYRVYILIGITFLIISGATAYLHQNSDTVNKTDVSGTACSQEPNYNINKVTQAWLLEKLELPEPHATQAALAVNDPLRFEDVLRDYFLKCPLLIGLPTYNNIEMKVV